LILSLKIIFLWSVTSKQNRVEKYTKLIYWRNIGKLYQTHILKKYHSLWPPGITFSHLKICNQVVSSPQSIVIKHGSCKQYLLWMLTLLEWLKMKSANNKRCIWICLKTNHNNIISDFIKNNKINTALYMYLVLVVLVVWWLGLSNLIFLQK